MPLRPRKLPLVVTGHRLYSSSERFSPVYVLRSDQQKEAHTVDPKTPVVFQQHFRDVPAISKWFIPSGSTGPSYTINATCLKPHEQTIVPLELSTQTRLPIGQDDTRFERFEGPLGLLLADLERTVDPAVKDMRLYLAQCPLEDLPSELKADLPTPEFMTRMGKGDIYGSSLWMGRPPTITPLHRDPNPNLFVQLAGKKVVRLMRPDDGRTLYETVRAGNGYANMRGEEMFVGEERRRSEEAVWDDKSGDQLCIVRGWEAELEGGDGLYIPLGWWHAVRGVGAGVNASVNWWFR